MCLFPVYRSCPSLVDCKATRRSLKLSIKPDLEVSGAIEYLFKIREDLERGSAVNEKTSTEWFTEESKPSISAQLVMKKTSQRVISAQTHAMIAETSTAEKNRERPEKEERQVRTVKTARREQRKN